MTTDTASAASAAPTNDDVQKLFDAGVHYGYSKSKRHPSTSDYIFGVKNTVEIFDLEKTVTKLADAKAFVSELGKAGKKILFVTGKAHARKTVREAADKIDAPYVAGRWIGGTLTNFDEITKRVNRLKKLRDEQERGGLEKYTKHERLLLSREAARLEERFGGIVGMDKLPTALFVIDPKDEDTAVREAARLNIPVIGLASSDNDINVLQYAIPGNDSNINSITFILNEMTTAYKATA